MDGFLDLLFRATYFQAVVLGHAAWTVFPIVFSGPHTFGGSIIKRKERIRFFALGGFHDGFDVGSVFGSHWFA